MKRSALITVAVCCGLSLVGLSFIKGISNLTSIHQIPAQVEGLLLIGHFESLFIWGDLWRWFPALPKFSTILSLNAFVMMSALGGVAYFIFRVKLKLARLKTAWIISSLWIVPCLLSLVALRGNEDFERVGSWLALVLASFVYSLLACAALAAVELLPSKSASYAISTVPRPRIVEYPF